MYHGVLIHAGINFISNPAPTIDKESFLSFQRALMEAGVEFEDAKLVPPEVRIISREPLLITIMVKEIGPGAGQLLIVGPEHPGTVGRVGRQAQAITRAYHATWTARNRQLINIDSTIRMLYETDAEHAFQELWEGRLRQREELLDTLGRPVLGGGLRFVMPPESGKVGSPLIEVKIESSLRDSSKFFVETQFIWRSLPQDAAFDALERLRQVNDFIEDRIEAGFMAWTEQDNEAK